MTFLRAAPNRFAGFVAGFLFLACAIGHAAGQSAASTTFNRLERADSPQLDLADGAILAELDRAKSLAAERHADEAVEIFRRLAETSGEKLVASEPGHYVRLADWCQRQLLAMPPESLKLYRDQVDPIAQAWYEGGLASKNRQRLEAVADRFLAGSYGIPSLLALGDLAFEAGDFIAARRHWQKILTLQPPQFSPNSTAIHVALPAVQARLVLASILEGDVERARTELNELDRLYPNAEGKLGGRTGRFSQLLQALIAESVSWPPVSESPDWYTFAGNFRRNRIALPPGDLDAVQWRFPLPPPRGARVGAEGADSPVAAPPYFPLSVGPVVFVNNGQQIFAVRSDTGQPAWGPTATVYADEMVSLAKTTAISSEAPGVQRFTMTVYRDRLLARMGVSRVGASEAAATTEATSCLVCLDLAAEGRLLWKRQPDEGWAFEGTPVADGQGVYVAMQHRDIHAQTFVACLDPDTGRMRWRRFICGGEMPSRDVSLENVSQLLTLSGDAIYYNTNLGVVAAIRAADGRMLWAASYPRMLRGRSDPLASLGQREPTPGLLARGVLLVAPSDNPCLFAFDAASGQSLWRTDERFADVQHLLGAADESLIASGRRLYWISMGPKNGGQLQHVSPEHVAPSGSGCGVLAGRSVLWPTRDKLYVFEQRTSKLQKAVDLKPFGAAGGNLLATPGQLLIATERELLAVQAAGSSENTPHSREVK